MVVYDYLAGIEPVTTLVERAPLDPTVVCDLARQLLGPLEALQAGGIAPAPQVRAESPRISRARGHTGTERRRRGGVGAVVSRQTGHGLVIAAASPGVVPTAPGRSTIGRAAAHALARGDDGELDGAAASGDAPLAATGRRSR